MAHKRLWIAKCLIVLGLSQAVTSCGKSFVAIPSAGYAIGIVDSYVGTTNHASIFFHFTVQGKTNNGGYPDGANGWSVPDNADIKIGDQYIVQYDTANLSDARMLFCYRVTDSAQYNQYITMFAGNPPGCH
jgi:hypothetical protein